MPPLRVPERFRAGILRAAKLPQEKFDELLAAVSKAPRCKDTRELVLWITDETPSLSESDRKEIIYSIVPMFRVQRNSDVSPAVFAQDVWGGVIDDAPKAELEGVDRTAFIARISTLVEQSSLDLASSRISDAKREVERNFCKVRVFTDLRPTFTKDLDEPPSDIAVIHHFQIGYHDSMADHQEFYISLDAGDLEKLKKAIVEAEKKAQTLETMLQKDGVRLHK